MKYKLPQPILTPHMIKLISREIKRLKIGTVRPTKREMQELAAVCKAIRSTGLPKNLVCKKLPGKLGSGIFLHPNAEPLAKGQIIAAYAGKVELVAQNVPDDSAYAFAPLSDMLLTKEEQHLYDPKRRYHPRRLYSLNIDAVKSGNFTRYINHSEKPNISAELFRISKNKLGVSVSPIEVVYLVKKKILPGEQLLVSYEGEEKSYWSALGIQPDPVTPKTYRLSKSLQIIS
jgi:hypothetical protein